MLRPGRRDWSRPHGDGHLAANGTAFQLPHRICRVLEWVGAVQGWVDLPGLDELKGSGLLSGRLPPNLQIPLPFDSADLRDDEDPLDPDDLGADEDQE